jgi:hypothetical protein
MFGLRPKSVLTLQPGDIIGFSGDSWISDFINLATYGIPRWGISHMGIMGEAADGRLLLFESTTLDGLPCEITREHFNGTQAHTLDAVVRAYQGKVWHYRLYRSLYENERQRLTRFLMGTVHTPYDDMGAFRSGGIGLSWIESLFREQDLTRIFCSEWVAAALACVGLWITDNVSRWNPNRLTRRLRSAGVICRPRRLK